MLDTSDKRKPSLDRRIELGLDEWIKGWTLVNGTEESW